MATIKELSLQYFEKLRNSTDPVVEFERIISEINGLVYSETKEAISDEEKAKIILLIINDLENDRVKFFPATESTTLLESTEIVKAFSNDNYLDLINYIKMRTKNRK